jgi:hypothetical protein
LSSLGGRVARRDIHKRLREKGMSLRQIAAETGVSVGTVHADLDRSEVNTDEEGDRSEVNAPDAGGFIAQRVLRSAVDVS